MDRVLCVILCLALIVVSVFLLGYCNETADSDWAEITTEPTQNTTAILETEPYTEETTVVTTTPTTAPEPTVVLYDIPLSEDLQLYIISLCEEHHIDPEIVVSMIFWESSFRSDVIGDNGDSYGLMQIQPKWHYERMQKLGCTNLLDPFQNVTVGVDILAEQLARYDGDIAKAVVAYNGGDYRGTVTQYAKNVLAYAKEINNERSH